MIRVKFKVDYRSHLYEAALNAMSEDRETVVEYGALFTEESPEAGVKVYVVDFDNEDGWEARGLAEETLHNLPEGATLEKVSE